MITGVIVDRSYINSGHRHQAATCPVALAASDAFRQIVVAYPEVIYVHYGLFSQGGHVVRYDVGENLTSWISRFDDDANDEEAEEIIVEFDNETFIAEIVS
jgi:hypothetical protein